MESILEEKDKMSFLNAKSPIDLKEEVKDPETLTLEDYLDNKRKKIQDPKALNESRFPNQYFSHGQGGDYRMKEGKDYVWNQSPDNFTTLSDWNS